MLLTSFSSIGWRVSATWPTTPLPSGTRIRSTCGGVADLETHAQLVGAVVEQQDGEDAVVDDGAHQLRGAAEQRLQVERGVQRVGELHQVGQIRRLDADIRRVEMRTAAAGSAGR